MAKFTTLLLIAAVALTLAACAAPTPVIDPAPTPTVYTLSPSTGLGVNSAEGLTPTALPSPTSTQTPTPTCTSTPTASPTPTSISTTTATTSPTISSDTPTNPSPSLTPSPTSTPTITSTSTATSTPPRSGATIVPPAYGRFIVVDQSAQEMRLYEDGYVVRVMPVSTGLPTRHTVTPAWAGHVGYYVGTFFSFDALVDNGWYLFRAAGGDILIHSAPYVIVHGEKAYQDLDALGRYPSSHGCIRLRPDDARWFTAWNPRGVPIVITPWTGPIYP